MPCSGFARLSEIESGQTCGGARGRDGQVRPVQRGVAERDPEGVRFCRRRRGRCGGLPQVVAGQSVQIEADGAARGGGARLGLGRGQWHHQVRSRVVADHVEPASAQRRHQQFTARRQQAAQATQMPGQVAVPGQFGEYPLSRRAGAGAGSIPMRENSFGDLRRRDQPADTERGDRILLVVPRWTTTSGAMAASSGSGAVS